RRNFMVFRFSHGAPLAAFALAFIALPCAAQVPASTIFCAQGRVSGNTTTLSGCNYANAALDVVTLAHQFVAAHAPDFKNPQATAELQLIDVAHGIGTQHVR